MELIRLLLLQVEGSESVDLSKYSESEQVYHLTQLVEAGFLVGHVTRHGDKAVRVIAMDLTWTGHDFLAAARSTGTWTKAMGKLKSTGLDVSVSVMKTLLEQYAKELLGLNG